MSDDWVKVILTALGASLVTTMSTWWFLYRRGLEPSSELDLNVTFGGLQANQMLIEVVAVLVYKSSVRQHYKDFQLSVRYLLPADVIVDGSERLGHQLQVPHSIDTRIGTKRFFGYAEYIDPGIAFRHSYITFVPAEATFLWLHAKLQFRTRKYWYSTKFVWDSKSMQRLVSMPTSRAKTDLLQGSHAQSGEA